MADIVIKRTVPPEVYAIALVAEGKKVVGVRMVDVSLKLGAKGSLFDFPLGVVEKAVRTDANLIRNLAFNGSLRLINGDIRKFPVVDTYARASSCVKHDYAGRTDSRVSNCKLQGQDRS